MIMLWFLWEVSWICNESLSFFFGEEIVTLPTIYFDLEQLGYKGNSDQQAISDIMLQAKNIF